MNTYCYLIEYFDCNHDRCRDVGTVEANTKFAAMQQILDDNEPEAIILFYLEEN